MNINDDMAGELPLVSIVVITYNSSCYILETLESIKKQTYSNLELIITDDCSKDKTVELCRAWLETNGKRFVRTILLYPAENTGIPANCNRGYRKARGEWIKGIAGDDLLPEDSIWNYISAASQEVNCLVGYMQSFCADSACHIIKKEVYPLKKNLSFFSGTARMQHQRLLVDSFNFAPGVFIRKSVYDTCGGFDERFRYLEDLPYWLKLTSKGVKFDFLPDVTVLYRTEHESMVFSNVNFFNTGFYDCLYQFRKTVVYPQVSHWNFLFYQSELVEYLQYKLIVNVFKNRKNRRSVMCYKILSALKIRRIKEVIHWFRR